MSEIDMKSDENLKKKHNRKDFVRFAVETLKTAKDFQLVSALGCGTYGDVYEMYDPERESNIAIKIVTSENAVDLESTLWPELEHPNIVPLLEILTLSLIDVTVFVMPVQRRSLLDELNDKRFLKRRGGFTQVKKWMFEVLCALEYIGSKNLCHLDIKVDNVLISNKKIAMLCDFSFLNTTVTPLNRHALGLPYIYRPPEVCQTLEEEVYVDGGAYDMWGYGIMVLEIITRFVIVSEVQECDCWMSDVYPIIFDALQEEEFSKLVTKAFPADVIRQIDIDLALNFIHGLLVTDFLQRASPVPAKRHLFLNYGFETWQVKDEIWIRKSNTSCSSEKILKVSKTDSNNAGDVKTVSASDYSSTDSDHSIRDSRSNLSDSHSEICLVPFQSKYGAIVESQTKEQSHEVKKSFKHSSDQGQMQLLSSKKSSISSEDDTERNQTTEINSDKSKKIDSISLYATKQIAIAHQDGSSGISSIGVESFSLKLKKRHDTPIVRFRDTLIATSDQDNFSDPPSTGVESFSLKLKKRRDTPIVRFRDTSIDKSDQNNFSGPSSTGVESFSLKLKKRHDTPIVRFRDISIATSDQDSFSGPPSTGVESFSLKLKKQHDTPIVRFRDKSIAASDHDSFSGPSSTGVESFSLKKRRVTPKVTFGENGVSNSFRNDRTQSAPKSFFVNFNSGPGTTNDETEDTKIILICAETHENRKRKDQFTDNQLEFQLMRRENIQMNNAKTTTNTASLEFSGNTVDPKKSSSLILKNKGRTYAMYSGTINTIDTQDDLQNFGKDRWNMKWTEESALNGCRRKFYKMAETKVTWTTREFLKMCEEEPPFMEEKEIPLTSQLMSGISMNGLTNILKDIECRRGFDVFPETRTLRETSNVIDKLQKTLTPTNCLSKERNTLTKCLCDSVTNTWSVPVEKRHTSMSNLGQNEELINFEFRTMPSSKIRGNASIGMKGDNSTDQTPSVISCFDDFNETDLIVDLKASSSKEFPSFESDTWTKKVFKSEKYPNSSRGKKFKNWFRHWYFDLKYPLPRPYSRLK